MSVSATLSLDYIFKASDFAAVCDVRRLQLTTTSYPSTPSYCTLHSHKQSGPRSYKYIMLGDISARLACKQNPLHEACNPNTWSRITEES